MGLWSCERCLFTDTGEVLSWGQGNSGRLGHGHDSSFMGFLKSSRLRGFRFIQVDWRLICNASSYLGLAQLS